MVCPHRPQMTQVQHWAKMAQTDHVTLQPWPLPMEVMAHVADVGRRRTSVYHVWSPCALPFGRYGTRCVSALIGVMTLTFDLETGMRVASKLGNVPSKFGHARPLGPHIICYVCDGRTDKNNAHCPLPDGRGHNNSNSNDNTTMKVASATALSKFVRCCYSAWMCRLLFPLITLMTLTRCRYAILLCRIFLPSWCAF